MKTDVNVPSKSNKKLFVSIFSATVLTKKAWTRSARQWYGFAYRDPHKNVPDNTTPASLGGCYPYKKTGKTRGLQGDVVNLSWPIAPLVLWAQKRRKRGFAGSQPMRTAVHITWNRAQINFGDLPPYLTYEKTVNLKSSKAARTPLNLVNCGGVPHNLDHPHLYHR
jgi:hypothetical protein